MSYSIFFSKSSNKFFKTRINKETNLNTTNNIDRNFEIICVIYSDKTSFNDYTRDHKIVFFFKDHTKRFKNFSSSYTANKKFNQLKEQIKNIINLPLSSLDKENKLLEILKDNN